MRLAAAVACALAACGGATKSSPAVQHVQTAPPPADPAAPKLADVTWFAGTWRSEIFDARWQEVAGAFYGVVLPRDPEDEYEVNIIDDTDEDGRPGKITLTSIVNGSELSQFVLDHATPTEIKFTDPKFGMVRISHTTKGWRGDFAPPEGVAIGFDTRPIELDSGAALEAADRAFDADTAKDGADGWMRHFDEHGAMWRGRRIEGAAIRDMIGKTLAHGTLRWAPVASGVRGDLGFTLGTGTFTPASGGTPAKVSYCTLWKHQADGSWKVLFDIGRPAS